MASELQHFLDCCGFEEHEVTKYTQLLETAGIKFVYLANPESIRAIQSDGICIPSFHKEIILSHIEQLKSNQSNKEIRNITIHKGNYIKTVDGSGHSIIGVKNDNRIVTTVSGVKGSSIIQESQKVQLQQFERTRK